MIWGVKDMIAGCIERMRRDACGGCERRDACADLFKALRFDRPPARRAQWPQLRSSDAAAAGRPNPFLAFLGEVAKVVEARARPKPSPFRREVERIVEPLLPSGNVRIEEVARELGCSRQTLYRKLKTEGVTFAQLLDALRQRIALRLVRDERVTVKEAAWRLGFSDPAAFSRAFKRWTGQSPREMRG